MKKYAILIVISVGMIFTSCEKTDINTLLRNQATKNKIFTEIVSDHDLMTEIMEKMMSDNHAKMMIKENSEISSMMMMNKGMMSMMKDKPEMMHSMMSDMMNDEKMMGHMMNIMHEEGMMSDACKESCMKMMSEKGMNMEPTTSNEDKDHESHNH